MSDRVSSGRRTAGQQRPPAVAQGYCRRNQVGWLVIDGLMLRLMASLNTISLYYINHIRDVTRIDRLGAGGGLIIIGFIIIMK